MSNSTDIAAHTDHAASMTARALSRPLGKGCCYAVQNVHGERGGFMPLVDGEDVMTDKAKAELTIEALAAAYAGKLTSPRLVTVTVAQARAWLAA